ncbi:extensin-like protein [Zea mays]|uniref:Extensin-like protein n=1 Tax=Zea mays TaxID=4577 RepID=A0A1D6P719_MAIZE|nr:extensin-like protein [Zea mays]
MAPKVALFLALGLLFAAAAHGCEPYCPGPVVPTPPVTGAARSTRSSSRCAPTCSASSRSACPNTSNVARCWRGWWTSTPHYASAPPSRPTSSASTSTCPLASTLSSTTAARFAQKTSLAPTKCAPSRDCNISE